MRDISAKTKVVPLELTGEDVEKITSIVETTGYASVMFALIGGVTGGFSLSHGDEQENVIAVEEDYMVEGKYDATTKCTNIGYIGGRKFVKLSFAGSATSAVAILQNPDAYPVTSVEDDAGGAEIASHSDTANKSETTTKASKTNKVETENSFGV